MTAGELVEAERPMVELENITFTYPGGRMIRHRSATSCRSRRI